MKKLIAIALAAATIVSFPAITNADAETGIEYSAYIEKVADEYNICPELIESVIYYESGYNTKCTSDHGAIGLMQVIPKWNKDRMKRLGVTDLYDPYQNILVGTDILAEYFAKYNEAYLVLTAYNCGEYSRTFKKVQDGATWKYADKILERSAELEALHER